MDTLAAVKRVVAGGHGERELRIAALAQIRSEIPFDAYAWLLTDPQSCVGASPLAEVPMMADLPRLVRLKYLTRANRWTLLAPGQVVTLQHATGGDLAGSLLWRELLQGYGVQDVASLAFRDAFGCWGFLDVWRTQGWFSAAECGLLADLARVITPALRASLARDFDAAPADLPDAPGVLLLDEDLRPTVRTPPVEGLLRALLPPGVDGPVPAVAYNVAAQLLAREAGVDQHPPTVRVHQPGLTWISVSAGRLEGARPPMASIAVDFQPASVHQRSDLFARVIGLSQRETELLGHVIAGRSTREIASLMFLSEYTVQDHLKSVFGKAGVRGRRALAARVTGAR